VLEQFLEENGMKRQDVLRLGPVIGTHLGPDLLALFGVPTKVMLDSKTLVLLCQRGADSFTTWPPPVTLKGVCIYMCGNICS